MDANKRQNPFEYNESAKFIACVGLNGGYGDPVIRDGFRDAALVLMKEVVKSQNEDQYVYPIIYNARHSIELGLKIYIRMLLDLYALKGTNAVNIVNQNEIIQRIHTHDILELNNIIVSCYDIDDRLKDSYDPIISDLTDYAIDPEGDLFKYQYSVDEKAHMIEKNISSISLDVFIKQFSILCDKIDNATDMLWSLLQEYKHNTFTKHLSRKAINEIAKSLPQRSAWSDENFTIVKNTLMQKYNISSRELSQAITIIRKHREFCAEIGEEIIFGNLSKETVDHYNTLMDDLKKYDMGSGIISLDDPKTLEKEREATKAINDIASVIPTNELVLLMSFMETGKPEVYSEELENIYQYFEDAFLAKNHMLRKIAQEYSRRLILHGMKKCGQTTYLTMME